MLKGVTFDLDNTLIDYKSANSAALLRTWEAFSCDVAKSTAAWNSVAKPHVEDAFSDGLASFAYREERFLSVLERNDLPLSILSDMQDLYEEALTDHIVAFRYAESAIEACKQAGIEPCIVTEGPHDAQLRSMHTSNLDVSYDRVFSSNMYRISKTGGLFELVRRHLGGGRIRIMHIGDDYLRDVLSARESGYLAVHVPEGLASFPQELTEFLSC